jgi:tripartite-type tricarboxylate transporter receptor subunit TctC
MEETMKAVARFLLLMGVLGAPSFAVAQNYPTKPVTVVIPFTPAGSNDTIGRYLADGLSKIWKQSVVVENRPGAGSAIGSAFVSKAKPDGHTLLFVSGTFTTNAATQTNLPFDPQKDLQPVGMGAIGQLVIVTGTRVPMPTLADVVKQAKAQKIFYGTTGVGSITQFAAELLNDVAGTKMEPVHYKGGTDALIDMAGGRLDLYVGSVTQVLPSVANKTAKPVAIASKTRASALPDVPTVAEAGFPGAETDLWWGVFTSSGTPPEVVAKINEGVNTVMNTPEAAKFLETHGAIPMKMSVEEFKSHVSSELEKWKSLAKKHNITAN